MPAAAVRALDLLCAPALSSVIRSLYGRVYAQDGQADHTSKSDSQDIHDHLDNRRRSNALNATSGKHHDCDDADGVCHNHNEHVRDGDGDCIQDRRVSAEQLHTEEGSNGESKCKQRANGDFSSQDLPCLSGVELLSAQALDQLRNCLPGRISPATDEHGKERGKDQVLLYQRLMSGERAGCVTSQSRPRQLRLRLCHTVERLAGVWGSGPVH
mmetsp:Transcript_42954/g.100656  ORF Transcript_42954/g.100656 Transcript_42954/m.100656 type:complete len:213 (-) Transcript_42954:136-774(-)